MNSLIGLQRTKKALQKVGKVGSLVVFFQCVRRSDELHIRRPKRGRESAVWRDPLCLHVNTDLF